MSMRSALRHQGQPFGGCAQGGKIVADLEHAAGNGRERNGDLGFIEGERPLPPMPGLVIDRLRRDGERVRIGDEEIAIHVIARRDPEAASLLASKVCPVSWEMRPASTMPTGFSIGLPSLSSTTPSPTASRMIFRPMRCASKSRRVGAVIGSFDCRVVHEIHLEEAQAPVVQRAVRLFQVGLRAGVGGIEHIQRVLLVGDVADVDELTGGVVQQPVLVILKHPCALRYLEGRGPHTEGRGRHGAPDPRCRPCRAETVSRRRSCIRRAHIGIPRRSESTV